MTPKSNPPAADCQTLLAVPPGKPLAPGLYVVATPIGNLADITVRAVQTLHGCDLVACEDTRVTGKLLSHYGIQKPMLSYNDHNGGDKRPMLLEKLTAGARVALVSDAGTPLISDPGMKLVETARDAGISVFAVPGASSVTAALSIAGLPTDQFHFAGFLPVKSAARVEALRACDTIPGTMIFLEAPHRLHACLRDVVTVLGADRGCAVAREITKLYEEVVRGRAAEVALHFEQHPPRGEIVLLIAPRGDAPVTPALDIDALLREAMKKFSLKDAVAVVAAETGVNRKIIYARALALRK